MTEKKNKNFTKKLKMALAEQFITQTELARRLGISQASVSAWLHDKSKPEFDLLEKIAQATNKPINYFFPTIVLPKTSRAITMCSRIQTGENWNSLKPKWRYCKRQ